MARIPAEQRRQQLVAAAIDVAKANGVAATTTRAIAAQAGTSLATVHYCFASKQELLQEVLTAIIGQLGDAVAAVTRPGLPAEQMLRTGLRALWHVVESEPDRQLVTYELTNYALRTPGMQQLAGWQYEVQRQLCARQLTDIAEAARISWSRPVPVLARMLLMVIDGAVLGWLVDRDSAAALESLDALASSFEAFIAEPVG